MSYPTLEQVEQADRMQLANWYRFLSSPQTDEQVAVMNRLVDRFKELGGMNAQISKAIGW